MTKSPAAIPPLRLVPRLRLVVSAAWLSVAVLLAGAPSARAQDDVQALSQKVDRLQQQLSDLERQVYNGQAPAGGGGAAPTGDVAANHEVRLQQLENQVSNLTGQIEELRNSIQQLSTRMDKMSQDTDFRLSALEHGQPAAVRLLPVPPPGRLRARLRRAPPLSRRCRTCSRFSRCSPCNRSIPISP